jgi:hypothetical protein
MNSIDIESYSNLNQYAVLSASEITATTSGTTTILNNYYYGSGSASSNTGPIVGNESSEDIPNYTNAQTELNTLVQSVASHVSTLISAPIPSSTTFYPNINYNSGAITFSGTTITLDAQNVPNAYFFIKSGSAITFETVPNIILKNGASTCNIFWIAVSSIGFTGTNPPSIPGIFIAGSSITFEKGSNVNGRLYAQTGKITFIDTSSVNASCPQDVVCYAKGTLILTDKGFIPIEYITCKNNIITKGNIIKNDFVNNNKFKISKIKWIRKFKVCSLNKNSRPICIKKNALDLNLPFKDLYVSPGHGIFINNKLVRAKTLINNNTIFQDNECSEIEYYHVECNNHSAILANGILSESYLEIGNNIKV